VLGRPTRREGDRVTVRKIPHRNIALVLAAALLSASAATAQVAPRLPNALLGNWCFHKPYDNDPDPYIMWPDAKDFDECANRGGVRFWRRGSKWGFQLGRINARADCEIRKVTRVGRRYRVLGYCQPDPDDELQQPDERHFELWQSKTGMHWRDLGEEEDRK
jgi:hypothetical protein